MTKAEELYHQIAVVIPNITKGKMFGALCLKSPNGKAGVMFWRDYMVFKLPKEDENEVLAFDGVKVFAPMGDREMKGWTQVPYANSEHWQKWAEKAMHFVAKIEVPPKKKKQK